MHRVPEEQQRRGGRTPTSTPTRRRFTARPRAVATCEEGRKQYGKVPYCFRPSAAICCTHVSLIERSYGMGAKTKSNAFRRAAGILAAIALALAVPGAAHAAEPHRASEDGGSAVTYGGGVPCANLPPKITSVKTLPNETKWPNSSSFRVDGQGPGTLSISRALSTANTVTGTLGASKIISSAVGFNVTKTTTTTTSYSINLKSGERRQIQVGQVFQVKYFTWERKSGCAGTTFKTHRGSGKAYNFLRYTYRSVVIK